MSDSLLPRADDVLLAAARIAPHASVTPVLRSRISAPGQKPGLSSLLAPGSVAVTMQVNPITGVTGDGPVLAAMYGQRSGAAGEALKGLEAAYPVAMGMLDRAYDAGPSLIVYWLPEN